MTLSVRSPAIDRAVLLNESEQVTGHHLTILSMASGAFRFAPADEATRG